MSDENTTLSVPKDFAETLRQDFDGSNDWQRLHNWAEDTYKHTDSVHNKDLLEKLDDLQSYKNRISVDDVEDAVSRAIERDLPEVLRREMR